MTLRHGTFLSVLLALLLVSGCASKHIANEDAFDDLAARKAKTFTGDTHTALDAAEESVITGRNENLALYSPLHWQQMNTAISAARKSDLAGNDQQALESAARTLTLFESGMANKHKVAETLSVLLAQKQILEDIKADKVLPSAYKKQFEKIKSLAQAIEAGRDNSLDDDIGDLLEDMQELERDTMLELHWRPAQKTLEKAEDEGVDYFALETFKFAETLTEEANNTISDQYTNRTLSEQIGKRALRAAQHALYIGREAENIINMDIDDAEQAALRFESYLHQLAEALNAGDLRNMAFLDQTLALVQKANEQATNIKAPLEKKIRELTNRLQALESGTATAPRNP
ncbi:hypothetical protein [Oceanobacter sp. 3_MG-2023]|uniref:hypothetical protein n=1 Tax=Oceanobacter sp. 3_MG-2023 TaxID=3062622 RepID=UPI00273545E2|nr:hypothetical protein [Oceanobacter sp. 3_MG-2023]MDP2504983.1 hypothetical protein [Oceanobacter sp. 3_MG-2023]